MYGSTAAADTYHAARGNTVAWDAVSDKTIALLRGSEYIDQNFRNLFPGWKTGGRDQVREWPRTDAYDTEGWTINGVPAEVEYAAYEAALKEGTSQGSLFPEFIPGQQTKREQVGPIEVEYFSPLGIESVKPMLTTILGILSPVLIERARNFGRAVRA